MTPHFVSNFHKQIKKSLEDSRKRLFLVLFSFLTAIFAFFTAAAFGQFVNKKYFPAATFHPFSLINAGIFAVVFFLTLPFSSYLCAILEKTHSFKAEDIRPGKVFVISFVLNILLWFIQFAVFFPGTGMNDTVNCLIGEKTSLLPPLFLLYIHSAFWFFQGATHSAVAAYAILVLIQMVFCSLIGAYFCSYLARRKAPKVLLLLSILFYSFMPIVGNYSVALLKDTGFAFALLFMVTSLFDTLSENPRRKDLCLFFLSSFLLCAIRTNGKLIVIPTLFILLFIKKDFRLQIILFIAFLIATGLLIKMTYYRGVYDTSFSEAISVPLSQIAFTISKGGNIGPDEKAFLDNILSTDTWGEAARFSFVDYVKFDESFDNSSLNAHKWEFIKVWFRIFTKNPELFFEAYVYQSYGYWNLAFWYVKGHDPVQSTFYNLINNVPTASIWSEYLSSIGLENRPLLPGKISDILGKIYYVTANGCMLFSCGVMFIINLFIANYLMIKKSFKKLLCLVPLLLLWMSLMIASPGSLIYRYVFGLFLTLPFSISLLFSEKTTCGDNIDA